MKYRTESFFVKYEINPNISLQQLRVLFQTDPNKRKDLPIVVKLISSPLALLEEELFTIHVSNDVFLDNHANLLKNLAKLKQNFNVSIMKEVFKNFRYMCFNEKEWNNFHYYDLTGNQGRAIIIDFINCVFDALLNEFLTLIGEIVNRFLCDYYNELIAIAESSEYIIKKKENIIEKLCEYIENSLSLDENSKVFDKKFKCLLELTNVIDCDSYKVPIRYVINKMIEDLDSYGLILLSNYQQIASVFTETDLLEISSFINVLSGKYIDIFCKNTKATSEQIIALCKKIIDAYNLLEKSVFYLHDVNSGKYSFSIKMMKDNKNMAVFLVNAGVDWYEAYKSKLTKLNNHSSMLDMYLLIEHIMSINPSDEMKDILANIIISKSDLLNLLDFLLSAHSRLMKGEIKEYLDYKDIDIFIGKYYWVKFMFKDKTFLNDETFNNIRKFSFDALYQYEKFIKTIELFEKDPYTKRELILSLRKKICDVLEKIPPDYFFDNDTRVQEAVTKFGGKHFGTASESSYYIDRYCVLFNSPKTKYGREAFETTKCDDEVKAKASSDESDGKKELTAFLIILAALIILIVTGLVQNCE